MQAARLQQQLCSSHILNTEERVKGAVQTAGEWRQGRESYASDAVVNIPVLVTSPGLWSLFFPSVPFSLLSHMFHTGGGDYLMP